MEPLHISCLLQQTTLDCVGRHCAKSICVHSLILFFHEILHRITLLFSDKSQGMESLYKLLANIVIYLSLDPGPAWPSVKAFSLTASMNQSSQHRATAMYARPGNASDRLLLTTGSSLNLALLSIVWFPQLVLLGKTILPNTKIVQLIQLSQ